MSETKSPHAGLTRRSFLKTTAAVAGTAAFSGVALGCAPQDEYDASSDSSGYEVYSTTCISNCHGMACPLDVWAKDGKAFNIEKFQMKDKNLQGVCQRGYSNLQRMYSPERVKYPLRRVEGTARGAGEWEQIGWDEAIEYVCSTWKSLQKEYGDASILFSKGTGASSNITTGFVDRLVAYMGASTMPLAYDQAGFFCGTNCLGLEMPYTYWGTESRDVVNAKKVLVWGANPSEAATISFHHISKARENGAKLIVIDPMFTTTASKADAYVPIRPGSDGLLAMGMMKAIIRDGKQDEAFLKARTVGPFLVKKEDFRYLRKSDFGEAEAGSKDDAILVCDAEGNPATPAEIADPALEGSFKIGDVEVSTAYSLLLDRLDEWTFDQISELTDVPIDTIEWLASEYVDGPSMVFSALGIDHWVNGHTGYMNMYALMMVAGQLGKPGTGATVGDSSVPQAMGPNATAITAPADGKPKSNVLVSEVYDLVFNRPADSKKPVIKSMYFWTHNPIGNLPDRKAWLEVFDAMELVVVADIWMSESAKHADIVLPVSFMWEEESIAAAGNPYLRLMEKVSEPQFEAKGDFEIATLLGCGMGLEDKFQMTREDFLKAVLDNDLARSMGVTWDRLKKEKRIYSYPDEVPVCGSTGVYKTATGRAQFFRESPAPAFQSDQPWDAVRESLPYWEPPREGWYQNELHGKYPIVFMSERSKFMAHTQFGWSSSMLQELDPEPYLKISVEDAQERGIETGDAIKAYNDRGYVVIKAVVTPTTRPGIALIDHGWQGWSFIDGHYSDLSSIASGNVVSNTCFFDCLCQIEKVG